MLLVKEGILFALSSSFALSADSPSCALPVIVVVPFASTTCKFSMAKLASFKYSCSGCTAASFTTVFVLKMSNNPIVLLFYFKYH